MAAHECAEYDRRNRYATHFITFCADSTGFSIRLVAFARECVDANGISITRAA